MFAKIAAFFKNLFAEKPVPYLGPQSETPVQTMAAVLMADLPWMKVAYKYVGVHEIAGPKAHPKIAEWLKGVGMNGSDEIAWCAAAANGILKEAGYVQSRRANARSLLDVGLPLAAFKAGAIVIFWRDSIQGWQGHVGFAEKLSANGAQVRVLGGNQGNEFNSTWMSTDRVLGYRWPTPVVKS